MMINNWKRDIFTIPNILSLFRLALIPVYISIYLNATESMQYYAAGGILTVSCLTDIIDGRVARKYNMVSTLGKILDPVADKVTQFTLTLCLSLKYAFLRSVLILFLVKEAFQLVAGIVNLRKGKMLSGALPEGKVCTAVLFTSMIFLVLFPELPAVIVGSISILDAAFLTLSFISYIFAYCGKHTKVQDLNS